MLEEIDRLKAGATLIKHEGLRVYVTAALNSIARIFDFRNGYEIEDEDLMHRAFEGLERAYARLRITDPGYEEARYLYMELSSMEATSVLLSSSFSEEELLEDTRSLMLTALDADRRRERV